MTTPLDIISLALTDSGILGVGQTALAEDTNDAFIRLNYMLAQWARKRWLVWHLKDVSKVSTGATSYSVATGGDFNVVRPDRIEAAFVRQVNTGGLYIDTPLIILEAREDYNRIALKTMQSFPNFVFYDSGYPTGTLYPWPVPQATIYEIHITVKEPISQFTTLQQEIVMPPEYMAALHYNLAVRLRAAYQMQQDPQLTALAKDALNVIRGANAQIKMLQMPQSLGRQGLYNVYSDRIY